MKVCIESTNVDGVLEITSPDWDGKIMKMTRERFTDWRAKGRLPQTAAVYALYADHFEKKEFGKELYIGHTASIEQRVLDHLSKKDFWSILLVFVSQKDWMNVAYTQNIEYQFIKMAKNANRYDVKNGNDSSITHLGEEDKNRLDSFIKDIPEVLKMAGIDIFSLNLDGIYSRSERRESSQVRVVDLSNRIVQILAGSTVSLSNLSDVSNLEGVTVNKNEYGGRRVCTFKYDTTIKVDNDIIPKLLGASLSLWKSECSVKLSKLFK